jgi:hypothetical protein
MANGSHWRATDARRKRFAMELFVDMDVVAAYQRAGFHGKNYNTLASGAHQLLAEPRTQAFLAEEFQRLQGRLALDQDRHALEVTHVAYSDLRDVCSWGPQGVALKPSDAIPAHAARAIQSVKSTTKTRMVENTDGQLVPETETRTEVTLHPKVAALTLLHTMFDRGQTVRQHLEGKLREVAGIAAKYVPREHHAQYLAEVHQSLGGEPPGAVSGTGAADA